MIRASAPGKLMLSGEYTVADGSGPALAVAIDKRVTVTVEPGGDRWRVTSEDAELSEADPEEVPVVAACLEAVEGLPDGGHVTIVSELGVGPGKPGLGGSAAICVALMGALKALVDADPPTLDEVVEVHRRSQSGLGSGYDVATSLTGGVVMFDPTSGEPTVESLEWPEGLHAATLFTGQGASTTAMLQTLDQWRRAKPEEAEGRFVVMASRAREFVEAWRSGEIPKVLDAAADAQEALLILDRVAHIGIRGGGHAELLGVVEDAGALGRTSGAGGGDCVWALTDDEENLADVLKEAERFGFEQLEVSVSSEGLLVETSEDAAGETDLGEDA